MALASTLCLLVAAACGAHAFWSAFRPGQWNFGNLLARTLIPLVAGLVLRLLPLVDRAVGQ